MKKNIFKKLISLGLALTLTCSVGLTVMNNVPKTAIASAKLSEIEFWQTYSTDKILQDMPDIYDDIKQPAIIDLTAIRGEEEATQIIMTSGDKAVSSYDVTVRDLKFGNEVYSKENITVYHQKYIYVVGAEYYKLTGWFPDCLVPFENVKGVDENNFAKNNNQGLYISFEVPEDQLPGQYTGTIGVTIGGETKSIPITLDVSDAVIGAETNFLSCFQNKWHLDRGELDTSNEMLDAYNRKLFEYRLGCSNLLFRNQHTDREIEEYAKYAATYSAMPEFAGYDIPLDDKSYKNEEVYGRVINGTSRNPVVLKKYFMAIAYAGLEAGVDTFAKAFIYGRDEPDLNGTADSIVQNDGYIIRHTKEDAIATLKADRSIPADKQELLNQICESLDGIPHVVTSSTFMSSVKFDLEEEDMVYCPEFQYIETDSLRDQYRMSPDNDLWWYGCCNPDYPYPTYHTDDTVISARLLSWMQADYNIQGNLYWAADYYAGLNGANAPNNYAEDYYTGNNAARSVRTNGEGYLFYPGSKYDVYGPLPSVRLEQIRDGMEEADMIMALKEIYNGVSQQTGINFTEDTFMNYVYAKMYSGTKVGTTSEIFANCRQILIDTLELAQSAAKVCVTDVKESISGYTFKVFVADGFELKSNGKAVTEFTEVTGGKIYTVNVSLIDKEKFNISVDVSGKTYGVEMSFGSGLSTYDGEYLEEIVSMRNKNVPKVIETVVDASTVVAGQEGKWLHLDIAEGLEKLEEGEQETADRKKLQQEIVIKDSNSIRKINASTDKLLINLYNASDKDITIELGIEYGNEIGIFNKYTTIVVEPGFGFVSINNLNATNWGYVKYINQIKVKVGAPGDPACDSLYLINMTIYKI